MLANDPVGPQAAEAHHALAQIAVRRGDPIAARHESSSNYLEQVHQYLSLARATLVDDPGNVNERFRIASIFLDLFHACGDGRLTVSSVQKVQRILLDRAEEALLAVLDLAPEDPRSLFNMGFVRTMQNREGRWGTRSE